MNPRCEYTDFAGFDTRVFRDGEKVCVRMGDQELPGLFRGYAMDGHRIEITGQGERIVQPTDVGKTRMTVAPKMVEQLARRKNLPVELEGKIKKYANRGGKKSRKRHQKKRHSTRRRHS